jgi:hypothetical protein
MHNTGFICLCILYQQINKNILLYKLEFNLSYNLGIWKKNNIEKEKNEKEHRIYRKYI